MDKFITLEKNYLLDSKEQTEKRSRVTEDTHAARKQELKDSMGNQPTGNDTSIISRQKLNAEIDETDMYYTKAKELIKDIIRVSERAEEYMLSDEDTRAQAKRSRYPLEAMVPVQEKAYANLMETHESKQHAEMHLVKHQRLAGKPFDGKPPISALTDLFGRKTNFLVQKIDQLTIELKDVSEGHHKDLVNSKISLCNEIRKIEEDKFKALCDRLKRIFEENQKEIDRAVQESEEAHRKSEEEARERKRREQEENERLERIDKERKDQEDKERLKKEADERRARAQESALERRRLQGW